jgi:hypothetical protein
MKTVLLLTTLFLFFAGLGQCQTVICDTCGCCQSDFGGQGPTNCASCHNLCITDVEGAWCDSCGGDCSQYGPIIQSGVVPRTMRGKVIATKSHLDGTKYVVLIKAGIDAAKGKPAHPIPSHDPMSTWAKWVDSLPKTSACSLIKTAKASR